MVLALCLFSLFRQNQLLLSPTQPPNGLTFLQIKELLVHGLRRHLAQHRAGPLADVRLAAEQRRRLAVLGHADHGVGVGELGAVDGVASAGVRDGLIVDLAHIQEWLNLPSCICSSFRRRIRPHQL